MRIGITVCVIFGFVFYFQGDVQGSVVVPVATLKAEATGKAAKALTHKVAKGDTGALRKEVTAKGARVGTVKDLRVGTARVAKEDKEATAKVDREATVDKVAAMEITAKTHMG